MPRRLSAFGAALLATNELFDSIGDELGLPLDRDEWTYEDYEDERDAIGRRLVELSQSMAGLRGRLKKANRSRKRLAHAASREQARAIHAERLSGFGGPQGGPQGGVRSQLSPGMVLETHPSKKAIAIPLESGVYLVAEADSHILRSVHPQRVAKALQQSAKKNLLAAPGQTTSHWTSKL